MPTWPVSPLLLEPSDADDGGVEAAGYAVASGSRTVLPLHAHRRRSARDAALPLVLSLELLTGVAYGALHTPPPDDPAIAMPALPALRQVAAIGVPAAAAPAVAVPVAIPMQGPVIPRWAVLGPVVPAWVVAEPVAEPAESSPSTAAVRTGRNPFAPLTP